MASNPLRELAGLGQSVWLDYIRRDFLDDGGLGRLAPGDGLAGVTSNPSIFAQAVSSSETCAEQARMLLAANPATTTAELYEALAVEDTRAAADQLRGVYDGSSGSDGFVSLEVSPHLAEESAATVAEARHLRALVDRPNLMIKVPATAAGVVAVEELIGAETVNTLPLATLEAFRDHGTARPTLGAGTDEAARRDPAAAGGKR